MATEPLEIDAARELVLARATPARRRARPRERGARARARRGRDERRRRPRIRQLGDGRLRGTRRRHAGGRRRARAPRRRRRVARGPPGRGATLAAGEAIAISTGAMVPVGADAVVRVEDTDGWRRDGGGAGGGSARQGHPPRGRGHRGGGDRDERRHGDRPGGRRRAHLGRPLRGQLRRAPAGDRADHRRRAPGAGRAAAPGRDPQLEPALGRRRWSSAARRELRRRAYRADDPTRRGRARRGRSAGDVVVICGGVSVGEHDHVRPALAELGVEQVFWSVALRPGKPTYFGVAPGDTPRLRPARATRSPRWSPSCSSRARRFGGCLARRRAPAHRATACSPPSTRRRPRRTQLVRCRLELADDGWRAHPTGEQGSHVLTSMLGADALAILPPADSAVPRPASPVEVELLP